MELACEYGAEPDGAFRPAAEFIQSKKASQQHTLCEIGMPSLSTRKLSIYSLSNDQASFMFLEMFVPDLVPQLGSLGLGGLRTTLYYVFWDPCTDLHGPMPLAAKIL